MIERLPDPPPAVPLLQGAETLYEVELSATPSREWRAAFLRPPLSLLTIQYTPELSRLAGRVPDENLKRQNLEGPGDLCLRGLTMVAGAGF